jgi:hypothetical protein
MRARLPLLLSLAVLAATLVACASPAPAKAKRDPGACATCHLSEFQSAKHHVGERPTTCGVCHAQTGWHPSKLDHPFWELTGAHEKAKCFACHTGAPPAFKGTSKDCVSCHRAEYEKAPDHVARFPTTCQECHTTAAWKPTLPKPAEPAPEPESQPVPNVNTEPTTPSNPATPKPKPKPRPKPAPSSPPPDTVTAPSKRSH